MRRLIADKLGSIADFKFETTDDPIPGSGQVRIRVRAVALGFVDGLIAEGRYQMVPALPFCPGGEIAGTVDAVGPDVSGVKEGDRVVTWQLGGGLADYAIVPADEIDPIPNGLDFSIAAAMLVDYQTARYALLQRGCLAQGETVVVAGASGGVGSAAVQIAAGLGARVIALVSDQTRHNRAIELGALAVLSPTDPKLRDELKRQVPHGIDLIVDPVGGVLTETLFRSLAKHGRHLVIGFASGTIPILPANLALLKSASLVGVDLRHFVSATPDEARAACWDLFKQIVDGRLAPPKVVKFSFGEAKGALAATSSRSRLGKPLVLLG